MNLIKVAPISFIELPNWHIPRASYINAVKLAKETGGIPVDGFLINDETGSVIAHRWVETNGKHLDFVGYESYDYYALQSGYFTDSTMVNKLWFQLVDELNRNSFG